MREEGKRAVLAMTGIYLTCELAKDFEFLVLKTDRTFLAENIFCKLFAIAVIFFFLKRLGLSFGDIGFQRSGVLRGAVLGISLGAVTFSISYFAEMMILRGMGLQPRLAFFISNFSLSDQNITGVSVSALAICLLGNVFNVWAEEGLFRGLLFRLGRPVYGDKRANLIQAGLFGLWHVIVVVVWVTEGKIGIPGALIMAAGYVLLAGVLGCEWGMCVLLTGTLWAGIFEHFFNNFISNALHVVTESGTDELQIVRILLSNVLSLLLVFLLTRTRKFWALQTRAKQI